MATSGSVSFDLSIEEIIEDAFERCGGQGRSGYDLKSARRSLNILLSVTKPPIRKPHAFQTLDEDSIDTLLPSISGTILLLKDHILTES